MNVDCEAMEVEGEARRRGVRAMGMSRPSRGRKRPNLRLARSPTLQSNNTVTVSSIRVRISYTIKSSLHYTELAATR